MLNFTRSAGITALLVALRSPSGSLVMVPVAASRAKRFMVPGAGLRRRQNTSLPKGRAAKGRCAGSAGKLRP